MPATKNPQVNESVKFATPKIMECSCRHEYQDSKYGKNKRVHNPCKAAKGVNYRCTVCGNVIKKGE